MLLLITGVCLRIRLIFSGNASKPEPITTVDLKKYRLMIFSSSYISNEYGSFSFVLNAALENLSVSSSRNLSIIPTVWPPLFAELTSARPETVIIRYLTSLLALSIFFSLKTINFLPLYFHF